MKICLGILFSVCIWFMPCRAAQHPTLSPPGSIDSTQEKQDAQRPGVTLNVEPKGEKLPGSERPITDADVVPGKALKKSYPKYPKEAKKARVTGGVAVWVLVDEKGKVVKAEAVSGDPLLHEAAVKAAHKWRFEPTLLFGQPVKVTGHITFNFVLR
jgi:TonB family protein